MAKSRTFGSHILESFLCPGWSNKESTAWAPNRLDFQKPDHQPTLCSWDSKIWRRTDSTPDVFRRGRALSDHKQKMGTIPYIRSLGCFPQPSRRMQAFVTNREWRVFSSDGLICWSVLGTGKLIPWILLSSDNMLTTNFFKSYSSYKTSRKFDYSYRNLFVFIFFRSTSFDRHRLLVSNYLQRWQTKYRRVWHLPFV